jgi:hypothetical protein
MAHPLRVQVVEPEVEPVVVVVLVEPEVVEVDDCGGGGVVEPVVVDVLVEPVVVVILVEPEVVEVDDCGGGVVEPDVCGGGEVPPTKLIDLPKSPHNVRVEITSQLPA